MSLKLVTGAIADPDDVLTLAEFKAFIGDAPDDIDADIQQAIDTAFEDVEGHTGRAYGSRQYDLVLDRFPSGNIYLPKPPLISVDDFDYIDSDGNPQSLSVTTDYTLHGVGVAGLNNLRIYGGYIKPVNGWPGVDDVDEAITIRFTAGYAAPNTVPAAAKRATRIRTGKYYAYKGDAYNEEVDRDYYNTIASLIVYSFV